jgi:hypothetical protein
MNINLRHSALVVAGVAALSLGVAACGSSDSSSTDSTASTPQKLALTGESTTLVLDPATAKVLTQNKVSVAPVAPATAEGGGIAFPITGGAVDPNTLAGRITHSGGLEFAAGGTKVKLTNFVVNTVAGTLTSTVGGAKLLTLDLDLSGLKKSTQNGVIVASGVTAALTAPAAKALNAAFGVSIFTKGLAIGTVTIRATG